MLFVSSVDDKGFMLAAATDAAVKAGLNCGDIIKKVSSEIGSGGGGRPQLAQAGFKDISLAQKAVDTALRILKEM